MYNYMLCRFDVGMGPFLVFVQNITIISNYNSYLILLLESIKVTSVELELTGLVSKLLNEFIIYMNCNFSFRFLN